MRSAKFTASRIHCVSSHTSKSHSADCKKGAHSSPSSSRPRGGPRRGLPWRSRRRRRVRGTSGSPACPASSDSAAVGCSTRFPPHSRSPSPGSTWDQRRWSTGGRSREGKSSNRTGRRMWGWRLERSPPRRGMMRSVSLFRNSTPLQIPILTVNIVYLIEI